MRDPDANERDRDEVVAVLYEIGGRNRSGEDRQVREVRAADTVKDEDEDGPVSEEQARIAYRARRDRRAQRRGRS